MMTYTLFWFRRDLRREDNSGLRHALQSDHPVIPLFIFDTSITDEFPEDDHRVSLIYERLFEMDQRIRQQGSSLLIRQGRPEDVFEQLLEQYPISHIITNHDYEPQATRRDQTIRQLCHQRGVEFDTYQDQVIFEKSAILTQSGDPYKVFSYYKKSRLAAYDPNDHQSLPSEELLDRLWSHQAPFPTREDLRQKKSHKKLTPYSFDHIQEYHSLRDDPVIDGTTYLGPYLRFGMVSIRSLVRWAHRLGHKTFLSELIWREFFMMILRHFPHTVEHPFQSDLAELPWREDEEGFLARKQGKTGYPIVDAGMRQLAQTGYMHNRVRMIVASFLTKHLLIHRKHGERYFAQQLFDYELSSNIGNRQRAASTGVDAVPYFRIFNPRLQQKKIDPDYAYVRRRIPDFDPDTYIDPIVDHKAARERAITTFKTTKEGKLPSSDRG